MHCPQHLLRNGHKSNRDIEFLNSKEDTGKEKLRVGFIAKKKIHAGKDANMFLGHVLYYYKASLTKQLKERGLFWLTVLQAIQSLASKTRAAGTRGWPITLHLQLESRREYRWGLSINPRS